MSKGGSPVSPVFLELFQQLFLQGGGEVCPHIIAAIAANPLAVGGGGVVREDGAFLLRAAPLAQQPAHKCVQLGWVHTSKE